MKEASTETKTGSICVDEERSLWWFLGLSMMALGLLAGSSLTIVITNALTKRGYCVGGASNNTNHTRVELQLPELDTTLEMEEEEDQII